jgi:hypothetical protein
MSNIDTLVFLLTSTVLTNRILFMQYMHWLLLDDVFILLMITYTFVHGYTLKLKKDTRAI